ncbi:MAG: rod shape-determining protein RodA [Candidatus Marinimicrobia bacterium]|jgi:rod shape determining protein RodA|nr:rod shape-determining protein RodA [Candidatus Neomarinimicrobiota bacterium]MDD4961775.1 rod shape-determining protein RodA [Candidatus Neomarinimicrobiota bacterium]MDD5709249.1 rod shape-determining protein RodA [Candidatus Neomarinimicrobiota bacterium]MDX9777360.1 rod shape-determining protein RodA [bacterium]
MRFKDFFSLKFSQIDISTLVLVFILSAFGLVAIYSASYFVGSESNMQYFWKQMLGLVSGVLMLIILFSLRKSFLLSYAEVLYLIGIGLLIIPFILSLIGFGTSRWINLGIFQIQPSEYMKFLLIIMLAKVFSENRRSTDNFGYVFYPLLILLLPAGLVFIQPDLGTTLIYIVVFSVMLFASGYRLYYIFLLLAPFITMLAAFNSWVFLIWGLLLALVIFLNNKNVIFSVGMFLGNVLVGVLTPYFWSVIKPYQQQRILTMLNPRLDPMGAGYQVIQSQIAIGSGGLHGKGFLQGTQSHLNFLPEQHTDFIFSVVSEEFGFIGISVILFIYCFLIIRWLGMARTAKSTFSAMLIIGGTAALLAHILINVGMTVGLLPVTGKPLPFISYGGSFLMTSFGLVGLVLNGNAE